MNDLKPQPFPGFSDEEIREVALILGVALLNAPVTSMFLGHSSALGAFDYFRPEPRSKVHRAAAAYAFDVLAGGARSKAREIFAQWFDPRTAPDHS